MLGVPHFASMQFVVLYPLSFLYWIGEFPFAFNLFLFVHLFLAALFAYLFFRGLKFSAIASGFAAFSWMMSGYLVSSINLLNILGSITWFPLVLSLFHQLLQKQSRRYCVWASLALCMMFLGSEAGITVVTIWILLGCAIVYGWRNDSEGTRFFTSLRMTIRCWLPTVALFIGFSAFQWIPSIEYLLQTERAHITFEQATVWSVPPRDLLNLFIPFVTDPWIPKQDYWLRQSLLASYYVGSLPWIFLIWLFRWKRKQSLRWFLIVFVTSLIVVLGKYTPIYQGLYFFLPGLSWLRYPVRLFFIPTLLLCGMLAYGLDSFLKSLPKRHLEPWHLFHLKMALGIALCLFLLGLPPVYEQIPKLFPPHEQGDEIFFVKIALLNLWRTGILWVAGWSLLWLITRYPHYKGVGVGVLSLLLFWDLSGVHKGLNNTISIEEFLKSSRSVEFLTRQEGYFRICPSPKLYSRFQYLHTKDFDSALKASLESCVPNRLVPFGIFDVAGYDSIYLERYGKLWAALMQSKSPFDHSLYHLFNVRFLTTPETIPNQASYEGFELVYQSEQICIYENQKALPRAFLVPRAVFMSDEEEILKKIKSADFRPKDEVILENIEKVPGSFLSLVESDKKVPARIEIIRYTPNNVALNVQTDTPQILVLSDAYYPGWRATLDGKKVSIYRANYYLRAIAIPSGSHQVVFFYRPWWFFTAPMVSLISLWVSFFLPALDRKGRKSYN